MKSLFVAWQQPKSREWIPVARLDRTDHIFRFSYTRGVLRAREFEPFGKMDNIESTYESDKLFPLFSNRLLSRSRPEYKDYLRWLGLESLPDDPMTILALTGGIRGTDAIELFPLPEVTENHQYKVDFFVRGLPYLEKETINQIQKLKEKTQLYLMRDCQNENDALALALRTGSPAIFVGYCPKYYVNDLDVALSTNNDLVKVSVCRVNPDAPLNMRLLCSVTAQLPANHQLFGNNEDFQPVPGSSLINWDSISLAV